MLAAAGRRLPHGWGDLFWQLGIWFGFMGAYQIARGLADHDAGAAFTNGLAVIDAQRALHLLIEPDLQRVVVETGGLLLHAVDVTYWLSQFTVLGLALLWIYLRRNEAFARIRNWVLLTNMLGLIGYVLMPTAPPRFFPEFGFIDTLAHSAALNHGSGLIELASNPYAAMPSLHAADALIIGFAMATLVRSSWAKLAWTLWPSWVWFSVMATGNHYWLDIAAGVATAIVAYGLMVSLERRSETSPVYVFERRG
jgi:PAP2 superfamily